MIKFTAIPITLDAAAGDAESPRTITGVAVPWDVKANVSSGESVLFLRGAFDTEGKRPKLLENHDPAQLRGDHVSIDACNSGVERRQRERLHDLVPRLRPGASGSTRTPALRAESAAGRRVMPQGSCVNYRPRPR